MNRIVNFICRSYSTPAFTKKHGTPNYTENTRLRITAQAQPLSAMLYGQVSHPASSQWNGHGTAVASPIRTVHPPTYLKNQSLCTFLVDEIIEHGRRKDVLEVRFECLRQILANGTYLNGGRKIIERFYNFCVFFFVSKSRPTRIEKQE